MQHARNLASRHFHHLSLSVREKTIKYFLHFSQVMSCFGLRLHLCSVCGLTGLLLSLCHFQVFSTVCLYTGHCVCMSSLWLVLEVFFQRVVMPYLPISHTNITKWISGGWESFSDNSHGHILLLSYDWYWNDYYFVLSDGFVTDGSALREDIGLAWVFSY